VNLNDFFVAQAFTPGEGKMVSFKSPINGLSASTSSHEIGFGGGVLFDGGAA
jgi:hypothetical protein